MPRISIKPMSVNRAWQGKRFKTPEYKAYAQELMLKLPPLSVPDGPLSVRYEFGLSSAAFDWDNPIKPFQDVLQAKYGFDDRHIMCAVVSKIKVPKGAEYVDFDISSLESKPAQEK